jgi:hypothetical protein
MPYLALVLAAGMLAALSGPAAAQSSGRDGIADLIVKSAVKGPKVAQTTAKPAPGPKKDVVGPPAPKPQDPRAGEKTYEQARQLMQAIDTSSSSRHCGRKHARTASITFVVCSIPRSQLSPMFRSSTCRRRLNG